MSIEPAHIRRVISDSLVLLGEAAAAPEAVELLLLTAAHETHLGHYLYQVGLAPGTGAVGIFQMEPETHDDLQERLVIGRGRWPWMPIDGPARMAWDLRYATWMARIYYMQFPEPIPAANEIAELAHYYKRYYNTSEGAARERDVVNNYFRYVRRE